MNGTRYLGERGFCFSPQTRLSEGTRRQRPRTSSALSFSSRLDSRIGDDAARRRAGAEFAARFLPAYAIFSCDSLSYVQRHTTHDKQKQSWTRVLLEAAANVLFS